MPHARLWAPPPPAVLLHGASAASVMEEGELECLASDHPEEENSFDKPDKVG